jgi:hypothetical protein
VTQLPHVFDAFVALIRIDRQRRLFLSMRNQQYTVLMHHNGDEIYAIPMPKSALK